MIRQQVVLDFKAYSNFVIQVLSLGVRFGRSTSQLTSTEITDVGRHVPKHFWKNDTHEAGYDQLPVEYDP